MREKPTMSQQRRWQLKQQELGRCTICGEKAVSPNYCLEHLMKNRALGRMRSNCVARTIGGVSFDNARAFNAVRQRVARDYKAGMSSSRVGAKYKISFATVLAIAREFEVSVRSVGRHRKPPTNGAH